MQTASRDDVARALVPARPHSWGRLLDVHSATGGEGVFEAAAVIRKKDEREFLTLLPGTRLGQAVSELLSGARANSRGLREPSRIPGGGASTREARSVSAYRVGCLQNTICTPAIEIHTRAPARAET